MAELNIDPLFEAISGMFSIFDGIVQGVNLQATNIGQMFGIGLMLGAVVLVFGALFAVLRNGVGGFGSIFGRRV